MSKQDKKSATETLKKSIKSLFANYCREHMAEAIKRGMLHRVTSGYAITRPPLGYSPTTTPGLYKINRYGRAIRGALKELTNGKADPGTVVAYIEMMFHGMTGIKSSGIIRLKRLLSDPYYLGYIRYKGQMYQGLHEPLFSEEEHKKLWALIAYEGIKTNSLKSFDKSLQSH